MNALRLCLPGLLLASAAWLPAQEGPARSPAEEEARIEFLLRAVAESKLTFVRNGTRHTAADAATFLRQKWALSSQAKTAEAFIANCATKSSTTGQPYQLILADGQTTVPLAGWLEAVLHDHDLPAAAATPGDVAPKK